MKKIVTFLVILILSTSNTLTFASSNTTAQNKDDIIVTSVKFGENILNDVAWVLDSLVQFSGETKVRATQMYRDNLLWNGLNSTYFSNHVLKEYTKNLGNTQDNKKASMLTNTFIKAEQLKYCKAQVSVENDFVKLSTNPSTSVQNFLLNMKKRFHKLPIEKTFVIKYGSKGEKCNLYKFGNEFDNTNYYKNIIMDYQTRIYKNYTKRSKADRKTYINNLYKRGFNDIDVDDYIKNDIY